MTTIVLYDSIEQYEYTHPAMHAAGGRLRQTVAACQMKRDGGKNQGGKLSWQ
nr:hypothetical protein [uncultured Butyricicoccus sp.]